MLWTKFKYENKQRAITQKLGKRELWFLCTALRLDEIYPLIVLEICFGQRIGDAASPPATGYNIIRPVFDGRIKMKEEILNCIEKYRVLQTY